MVAGEMVKWKAKGMKLQFCRTNKTRYKMHSMKIIVRHSYHKKKGRGGEM
jgi:hypothetical protein